MIWHGTRRWTILPTTRDIFALHSPTTQQSISAIGWNTSRGCCSPSVYSVLRTVSKQAALDRMGDDAVDAMHIPVHSSPAPTCFQHTHRPSFTPHLHNERVHDEVSHDGYDSCPTLRLNKALTLLKCWGRQQIFNLSVNTEANCARQHPHTQQGKCE